ncbi:MAG: AAA family ATPase [Rickettsiales bacterium]|nr:AAA family ATPase [Rickettsiales bacterium]
MTFEVAKRQATPLLIAYVGTSGAGKTLSALLTAAGLAGESGKVGFIDTELGRGRIYADDPDVIAAMPDGKYFVKEITAPFSPQKYADAINEAIVAKVDVLIIDSATHWWEGSGGCQDIAENNKLGGMPNWAKAKMEHKKLMNMVTQCPMHIIFCVRAREKSKPVKVIDKSGKEKTEIVNEGLQAIQEKNFMYDMTVSLLFDEENPGRPKMLKCPKPLRGLFTEQALVTKSIGQKLKAWADGGESIDTQLRNLKREFRDAAGFGNDALQGIHARINKEDPDLLKKVWTVDFSEEVKALAKEADSIKLEKNDDEVSDDLNEVQKKLYNKGA